MITAGELRRLISGKPDTERISLYVKYDQVDNDYIFVRTEALSTVKPDGALCSDQDPPGLYLTWSLVDGEEESDA